MPKSRRARQLELWACCLAATLALGAPARALEVPPAAGRVTDLAGLLESDRLARIEATLERAEADAGVELFVLTLPTLAGEPLEEFSVRVARDWRIGHEGRNDGVLLLVVRDDRLLRLEVGYGLEAELTDLESARLLDEVVAPRLRADAPGEAIEAGVGAVLAHLGAAPAAAPESAHAIGPGGARVLGSIGGALLLFLTLRLLAAPGSGAWFVFAIFILPCYSFFATLAPPTSRGRVALILVLSAAAAFVAGRVFVRHTAAGRLWARSSRIARWLGADKEKEQGSSERGLSRERDRSGGWSSGGFSGGGGDFGGGGASTKW